MPHLQGIRGAVRLTMEICGFRYRLATTVERAIGRDDSWRGRECQTSD